MWVTLWCSCRFISGTLVWLVLNVRTANVSPVLHVQGMSVLVNLSDYS
jgi:hypothetical protein